MGKTPRRITTAIKKLFIETLAGCGNVTHAAQGAGRDRGRFYLERARDQKFAEAWDNAIEKYADKLEKEADRRAVEGTARPVFYKGYKCGYITEYSDTLLIFRLKALRPEKYRERFDSKVTGEMNLHADRSIEELINIAQGSGRAGGDPGGAK
jgi:hypothetical protein